MIKDFQRNRVFSQPTAGQGCPSRRRVPADSSQLSQPPLGGRPLGTRPLTPSATSQRPSEPVPFAACRAGPNLSGHPPWRTHRR